MAGDPISYSNEIEFPLSKNGSLLEIEKCIFGNAFLEMHFLGRDQKMRVKFFGT
jgi:hypothetical protein